MRDSFLISSNPSASPKQGAAVSATPETVSAIFISTSAKFAFVTALLWLCIGTFCALAWMGAFSLGMKIAHLLARAA